MTNDNTRLLFIALLIVVAGGAIYLLAPVLTPFLVAALFAYLFNPLVLSLKRYRVPRAVAVTLVFVVVTVVVLLLLLFLIPILQRQIAAFVEMVPEYIDWLQTDLVPRLQKTLGQEFQIDFDDLRAAATDHWKEVGNVVHTTLTNVAKSGLRFASWIVNLALIPIVTFYLLLDWHGILARGLKLFSPSVRPTVLKMARDTDEVLGSFLRGQLLVMLALAAMYSTGLVLMGLNFALPIGIVAGLLNFAPYLGFLVGLVAAMIVAYVQFHDGWALVWVLGIFSAAQVVESYFLTPRLVGARIGLHPVVVIFAVLAGGELFGFVGVLLALPVAAVLKVWLGYLHESAMVTPPPTPDPVADPQSVRRSPPNVP